MARNTKTFETQIELMFDRIDVHYEHYPATYGRRERNSGGLPLEPDFPEQIEITHVYATRGETTLDILGLLTESDVISLEDEILESMRD